MSIARIKNWIAGEVLTASDINAEFSNPINNALALISPLTGTLNFSGNQATNLRLEVQTATQTAAAEGVVYWQSTEDCLHISTGTVQARVPALTELQAGDLIAASNSSGVSGATTYGRVPIGSAFSVLGTAAGQTFAYRDLIPGTSMGIVKRATSYEFNSTATVPTLQYDSVRKTSAFSTASASFVDVSGLNIGFTTGARRCLVTFTTSVAASANNAGVDFDLVIDGSAAPGSGSAGFLSLGPPSANVNNNASISYLTDVLTVASHSFKIQTRVGSGATVTLPGNTATILFSVMELL